MTNNTTNLSPFRQALSVVPAADRAMVSLAANRLINTQPGWRPSDAARRAVAAYQSGALNHETFPTW